MIVDRAIVPLDYRITEDHQITLKADNPAFVDMVVALDDIHKDTAPTRKLPRRVK